MSSARYMPCRRTQQDYDLQQKLKPMMVDKKPLPSIYFPDFIAANQSERADNVLAGSKQEQMDQVRFVRVFDVVGFWALFVLCG